MKKIILFLILLFDIYYIKAYENDYFSITMPDEYILVTSENTIYKWENDNKYISITISDNNVKNYTEKDIENQKIYIEETINNSLSDYESKVSVTEIEKSILNDFPVLNYTIYWPVKEQTGYYIYQYGNVISTENYIYTIVFNTNSKDDDINSILNSFFPKDKINIKNDQDFIIFIIGGLAFIFAILHTIKKHKKKN